MNYEVHNYGLDVGKIDILGVSSSSIFIIGDTDNIILSSVFDTPPESYIVIPPFVPLG